ncbi:MAG: 2OG-Fe(II) oxygenase [Gammaproteobacteria bacterium]|nr:2OG-Fe(II) oxygenase [Gammaproteobacteria bacterium]
MLPYSPEKSPDSLSTIRELAPNSFIFERPGALPESFCAEVIRRFEANPEQQRRGVIGQTGAEFNDIKRTMDLVVSDKDDWQDIDQMFFRCCAAALKEFRQRFDYFQGPFKDMGYQVQRYQEGEFYHWHIDGGSHQFSQRQLVMLWYLNAVEQGGETDFLYQELSVTPETGKLVIFPPFWTHEHRARAVTKGVKYIATTWIVFA